MEDDEEILISDDVLDDSFLSVSDDYRPDFRWSTLRREFVIQYARYGRAGEACTAAGINFETGSELLKLEPIREAITEEVKRQLLVVGETENSVIARWALWANANVSEIFDGDWNMRRLDDIAESQKRCIKKVKVTHTQHGRNIEIEMFDAHKANNDLATMMGLLGKGDNDTTPPEETARELQKALQEIRNLNGTPSVQPYSEEQAGEAKKRLN